MNEMDRDTWSAVESRLASIEAFIPEAPPWRPVALDDGALRAGVRFGSAFGRQRIRGPVGRRWILVLAIGGLLVALVAGAIVAGSLNRRAQKPPEGRNGTIAMVGVDDHGVMTVVGVDEVGGARRPLVAVVASSDGGYSPGGRCPAFSRDGTRLAYVGLTGDIMVAGSDGSSPQELFGIAPTMIPGGEAIAWAPDGSRIAYVPRGDLAIGIVTIANRTTVRIPLTGIDRIQGVAWAPDSHDLAILASLGGNTVTVFRAVADGSTLHVLADHRIGLVSTVRARISWSPDGSTIAYSRQPDGAGSQVDNVFLLDADGSKDRQLTYSATGAYGSVWNGTGSRIAFFTSETDGSGTVMAVGSDGADPMTVARGPAAVGLAWSPDGRRILVKHGIPPREPVEPAPPIQTVAADGSGNPIVLGDDSDTCLPSWQRLMP